MNLTLLNGYTLQLKPATQPTHIPLPPGVPLPERLPPPVQPPAAAIHWRHCTAVDPAQELSNMNLSGVEESGDDNNDDADDKVAAASIRCCRRSAALPPSSMCPLWFLLWASAAEEAAAAADADEGEGVFRCSIRPDPRMLAAAD